MLSFLEELDTNLEKLAITNNVFLVVDFNIDLLKQSKSQVFDHLNILASYGIESQINAPTREEILQNKLVTSCIDHVGVRLGTTSISCHHPAEANGPLFYCF